MLVPDISITGFSATNEHTRPEDCPAAEQPILACVQVRSIVELYRGHSLTEYVFAKIASIILKHCSSIGATLESIRRQVVSMVQRIGCSSLTVISAAYLLCEATKKHGSKIFSAACRQDPLRLFFVALIVSMSTHECSYYHAQSQIVRCRLHGSTCALLASWLDKSHGLFTNIDALQLYEAEMHDASRCVFPLVPSDLEYFAETCLTSTGEAEAQSVPDGLDHLLACLSP